MHVDSVLSANIQFAGWTAACVSRAVDYQLVEKPLHRWITEPSVLPSIRTAFTYESKMHLWQRSVADPNGGDVFRTLRPVHPVAQGQLLGGSIDPATARRMKAAAERVRERTSLDAVRAPD